MNPIFVYLAGSLAVSSFLMCWFNTGLQIHIVQLLHYFGFRKGDDDFWFSTTPMQVWTKVDLDNWKCRALPAWLDELSSCPGCLSVHASFWLAAFITLIAGDVLTHKILFFFLSFLGWPYLSNLFLKFLNRK